MGNMQATVGIIPARAGSTGWSRTCCKLLEDHPRSCGEHKEMGPCSQSKTGSSPLVRGAPCAPPRGLWGLRIIPARAGSTAELRGRWWRRRDHPRSCGEHSPVLESHAADLGSSPLVRGALRLQICGRVGLGIIPARAGSTYISSLIFAIARDHPRSCGEHNAGPSLSHAHAGSSPLVRGAPLC